MAESEAERLLALVRGEFSLRRGHPLPLGASVRRDGLNFAVFSAHATWVRLVLFLPGQTEPAVEIPLDPGDNRTGNIWHVLVAGLDPSVEYGFRAGREPDDDAHLHRFEPERVLLDLEVGENAGQDLALARDRTAACATRPRTQVAMWR